MIFDHMGALMMQVFYEPFAYAGGVVFCFGVALVLLRSVSRMLTSSEARERE